MTLDPHKWLYQPFECGCVLVRDGELLRSAFEVVPDYLKDAAAHAGEVNFSDLGFQLTRSSRALKVWLSLSYFGVDAFRAAIDRSLDLAARAERLIGEQPELELMSPAPARDRLLPAPVRGRRRRSGSRARLNAALVGRFEQSGLGLVSSTTLDGRYAIRLCILNHTTTAADVRADDRVVRARAGAVAVGPVGAHRAVGRGPRAVGGRRVERRRGVRGRGARGDAAVRRPASRGASRAPRAGAASCASRPGRRWSSGGTRPATST